MDMAVDLPGLAAILRKAHVVWLDGDEVRPFAPMPDCTVEPLILYAFVEFSYEASDWLVCPQIDFPVIGLLPQVDAKAFKGVGRIAPLVTADETPIQRFIRHATDPQPEGALLFQVIFAQCGLEVEL